MEQYYVLKAWKKLNINLSSGYSYKKDVLRIRIKNPISIKGVSVPIYLIILEDVINYVKSLRV